MFSPRVLLILVLLGAVASIASSFDEYEQNLGERGLTNRFYENQLKDFESKKGLYEDEPSDEEIDDLVARVAKLQPGSRGWSSFWKSVKSHAGKLGKAALHGAANHVLQSRMYVD